MNLLETVLIGHATASAGLLASILIGQRRRSRRNISVRATASLPTIGVVIPVYNARLHLGNIGRTLCLARDLDLIAVVVDDGSIDGSTADLELLCTRHGARLVRHDANRGKPSALNTGICAIDTDLVATIDADTWLTPADLLDGACPFLDARIGAVAIEVKPASQNLLSRIQAVEYRYVLDFERQGLSGMGEVFTVPGAASVWRRQALNAIGGFSDRTMAEDTDATIGIRASGWHVTAIAHASATTIAPHTLGLLIRQRVRWIWGTLQASTRQACSAIIGSEACRRPGLLFSALSGMHVLGFILPLWTGFALITGQLQATAIYAILILLSIGVARLFAALWLRDGSLARLPAHIVMTVFLQAVNTLSFWTGLIIAAPLRRRWR